MNFLDLFAQKPVSYTHLDVYKRQVLAGRGDVPAEQLPRDSGGVDPLGGKLEEMCIRDSLKPAGAEEPLTILSDGFGIFVPGVFLQTAQRLSLIHI